MHRLIQDKLEEIGALCQRYHVKHLEVFGSASRGFDFHPTSDADFLVEFEPGNDNSPLDEFFGFSAELSRILNRSVDLVEVNAVRNPYILERINRTREVVYGA